MCIICDICCIWTRVLESITYGFLATGNSQSYIFLFFRRHQIHHRHELGILVLGQVRVLDDIQLASVSIVVSSYYAFKEIIRTRFAAFIVIVIIQSFCSTYVCRHLGIPAQESYSLSRQACFNNTLHRLIIRICIGPQSMYKAYAQTSKRTKHSPKVELER